MLYDEGTHERGAMPCLQAKLPTREHTTGSLRITTTKEHHTGTNGYRRVASADDYPRNVPTGPMKKGPKAPAYLHTYRFLQKHALDARERGLVARARREQDKTRPLNQWSAALPLMNKKY